MYHVSIEFYQKHILVLYKNQVNARAQIGQSDMVCCASKPMEKSLVFWIIIWKQ